MLPEKRACAGRVERGSQGNAAWLTALGHRPMQQDVALMSSPLYGIFDGHGPDGLLTAQRAAELLRQHFARLASDSAPPQRITAAFEATQAALLSYALQENIENGTTATIAFHFERHNSTESHARVSSGTEPLEKRQGSEGRTEAANGADLLDWDGGRLWLANVGDSRAVLCRGGSVALASVDHDLTQQSERQRCEALGARVMETAGCMRLVPPEGEPSLLLVKGARRLTLNMSRALGHRILSGYGISSIPQLYELHIKNGDRLVIASDGLWDVLSNELVASILTYQSCPADAVTALFNEAMDHYTVTSAAADNISLLVLFFD